MQLANWATIAGALLLVTTDASAYPQFQFSSGTARCSLCHYSPSGGGLIRNYGRSEAAHTISRGGDGQLLHGLVWDEAPKRVDIGGDLRGAILYKKRSGEDPRLAAFPMQGDLYVRAKVYNNVSFTFIGGVRGVARDTRPSILTRLGSREHYLSWQKKRNKGPYLRAGRYFAPFGLRLPDHTAYVRRYLGYHTLEETYGVTYGHVASDKEWHASLFAPSPFYTAGAKLFGAAAYYERRNDDDTGAYGGQMRAAANGDQIRVLAGGVFKHYFEDQKLLLLTELNLGVQRFSARGSKKPRGQLAAYAELSYTPFKGLMLGGALERYDDDLLLSGSSRDAIRYTIQYFPWAHIEVHILGKLEFQGEHYDTPSALWMGMLHYYL